MYYTHVNIYTCLCASHMLKSLSSSNNLLLIALFQFMLSSLRLKTQRSLFHLRCLWYSKLWVSSPSIYSFSNECKSCSLTTNLYPLIHRPHFQNKIPKPLYSAQTHSMCCSNCCCLMEECPSVLQSSPSLRSLLPSHTDTGSS